MHELGTGTDWNSLFLIMGYGVLIFMYLVILKVLMNCIEQIMSSKNNQHHRSIIDLDIRQEAANRHIDDKNHTFDAYAFALAFLKVAVAIGGVVGIFIILLLKFNVFLATGVFAFILIFTWQFMLWREAKGREIINKYETKFIEIGGYNIGTLFFFALALILVTVGLIALP